VLEDFSGAGIHGFRTMYETSKFIAITADATSCRKSKIAANCSSNIYVTMAHIIKISTATPTFSGSRFIVVALPILWDVNVCEKSKLAAKLNEIQIFPKICHILSKFQRQTYGIRP